MAELFLVCEGVRDVEVLRAVFTRSFPAGVSVEGAGGNRAAAAVARYLASQGRGTVAYVCDRDYRRREEVEAAFTDGNAGFYWRRHSIENYLLQPAVVRQALLNTQARAAKSPGGLPPWAAMLPTEEPVIVEMLRQCAAVLAPREAARIAIWRLWEELSETAGRVQKRDPGIPSGSDAATCREALVRETARLRTKATETSTSLLLQASAVQERFDQLLTTATAPSYLQQLIFLEEFNGHDLLDGFRARLNQLGVMLSETTLAGRLIGVLPDVLNANPTLFGTEDFRDLANGVRALAGLAEVGASAQTGT